MSWPKLEEGMILCRKDRDAGCGIRCYNCTPSHLIDVLKVMRWSTNETGSQVVFIKYVDIDGQLQFSWHYSYYLYGWYEPIQTQDRNSSDFT
jgi:hypothetical protein